MSFVKRTLCKVKAGCRGSLVFARRRQILQGNGKNEKTVGSGNQKVSLLRFLSSCLLRVAFLPPDTGQKLWGMSHQRGKEKVTFLGLMACFVRKWSVTCQGKSSTEEETPEARWWAIRDLTPEPFRCPSVQHPLEQSSLFCSIVF